MAHHLQPLGAIQVQLKLLNIILLHHKLPLQHVMYHIHLLMSRLSQGEHKMKMAHT
jgi:hypothetical protein